MLSINICESSCKVTFDRWLSSSLSSTNCSFNRRRSSSLHTFPSLTTELDEFHLDLIDNSRHFDQCSFPLIDRLSEEIVFVDDLLELTFQHLLMLLQMSFAADETRVSIDGHGHCVAFCASEGSVDGESVTNATQTSFSSLLFREFAAPFVCEVRTERGALGFVVRLKRVLQLLFIYLRVEHVAVDYADDIAPMRKRRKVRG